MIDSGFRAQLSPGIRVLSQDQLERIHQSTLELLRRTGVEVVVEEVRDLLVSAGCWMDGNRVRIPPHLIDWALGTAPSRVVLCDRDGSPALELEGRKGYYGTGSDTPYVLDLDTGQRRQAVLQDVANVAHLVDALEHIDFLMCMGIASDVTGDLSDLYHFRAMLQNTVKPIVYTAWSRENLEDIIAMAEAVMGGAEALRRSPVCALYSEPISPLTHAKESCEKLLYIAGKGLPVVYTPGMMTGASAPVTLAGALVQANAELLSGLLICQLVREGAPMVYGGGLLSMDMSSGLISYAAPEFMLGMMALSEMGQYYRLPVFSFAGCSDSKIFDQQAGAEGAMWMLLSALSGGNLIHDVGYVESGLTASYEMIVAMDEVAGMVKRILRGVPVDDEMIGLDVIDVVGPGGHFLEQGHTLRHFRNNWFPKLMHRGSRAAWDESGQKTLGMRAAERARELLKSHTPKALDNKVSEELEKIIQQAEKRVSSS
ncbi:MAG: trimethylamine methyltransferase family protein [Anaerolineales bacterium]|jgi:trimethylamine--corrinoid protein Co-methyltransferase